ncbi:hypothetical protein AB0J72_17155 [Dactylosporangium sp. NPDC049742]|uniref:hypothetical protein n=1 Tax=Dactylosporangium sp. NPDC049742 TaxID=3154737 RepID=UPI003420C55C
MNTNIARWGRRLGTAVALTLMAAAATAVLAGPASASGISGLDIVEDSSGVNSDPYNEAYAECPAGTKVVGAGVTNTGLGQVVVDILRPETRAVYAHAYEDGNGFSGRWSLTVRAICAPDVELVNYEIVGVTSTPDSRSPKDVTSTCPGGKDLIGMGWELAGGGGYVGVTDVIPSSDHVYVRAYEENNAATNAAWRVTAYRICASSLTGLVIRTSSTSPAFGSQGKSQPCPVGKVALGGGANIVGGTGNVVLHNLWPGGFYANQWLMSANATEDDDGAPAAWHLTLNQICVSAA